MDKYKPALILYFTASLMYVLSIVFHWDSIIAFLFKPMITPAIFFYYWQESNGEKYLLSSTILALFYIGDMMILIEFENLFIPLLILNLIAYLILIFFITKDLLQIKSPVNISDTIKTISIMLVLLLVIFYFVLSLFSSASLSNHFLLIIYGIVLVFLVVETIVYYVLKNNTAGFFLLIAVLTFAVCDLFYVLYNYSTPFEVFININVFCQTISFYFIVNYFLHRKSNTVFETQQK